MHGIAILVLSHNCHSNQATGQWLVRLREECQVLYWFFVKGPGLLLIIV